MGEKNRNIIITPRDVDIFRTLASGPVMSLYIRDELKKFNHFKLGKKSKEQIKPDKKSEEQKNNCFDKNYSSLIVRLLKLREGGYIRSRRYSRGQWEGVYTLYALTPSSIEVLLQKGFKEKFIRAVLPKRDLVSHELQVSDVVRTIKGEASKLVYELDIEDENFLKRKTGGAKRNHAYPDLFVKVSIKLPERKVYVVNMALEVDNDTFSGRMVVEKLIKLYKQRDWVILMLCPTIERIERLSVAILKHIENERAVQGDGGNIEQLEKMKIKVFFALTNDFSAKVFLETIWVSPEGHTMTVVPKNIKTK